MSKKTNLPEFNLSLAEHSRMLVSYVKALRGVHRVEITKVRAPHSDPQRRYYRGVVVPCVALGLLEAWGEEMDLEETHIWLRKKFLTVPLVDRTTGEVVDDRVRSTTELDTAEFSSYLDEIIRFAADKLSTEVPPAAQYAEDPL